MLRVLAVLVCSVTLWASSSAFLDGITAADIKYVSMTHALDSYNAGAYEQALAEAAAARDFKTRASNFRREGPKWVEAGSSAERTRREHVLALVGLEITRIGFSDSRIDEWLRADVLSLLEWNCERVRRGPQTPFEHGWMLASIALIQGAISLGQNELDIEDMMRTATFQDSAHYRHALSRFPFEARFALAEVLQRQEIRRMPHQPFSSPHALVTGLTQGPAWMEKNETIILDHAIERLNTIARNQTTRAEVTLRRGILRFGRGDVTGALDDAHAALEIDPKSDPALTHVAHLYVGLALDHMGRRSEAVASYSAALQAAPGAKSASVALASDLFLLGRRDEAAVIRRDEQVARNRRSVASVQRGGLQILATLSPAASRSAAAMRLERVLSAVVLASATVASGSGQTQPPLFRTETNAVTVSVSVRQGNRPVPGLTSSDFQLLDNGVPQEVRLSDIENVPVDVTFILGTNARMARGLDERHKDIIAMARRLRPDDCLRLIEAGREVVEVMPFETRGTGSPGSFDARVKQSFWTMPPDAVGYNSIHDALVMSMIVPAHAGRRQLALALVSSPDGLSIASPARTLSVARVTETVLHMVLFEGQIRSTREMSSLYQLFGPYPFLTLGPLNLMTWREDMQAIAEATGGEIHTPGMFSAASASSTFDRIMTAYRESYLLRYQPTGVQREGWHEIDVKVTTPGRYNVEARRGYFVESVQR